MISLVCGLTVAVRLTRVAMQARAGYWLRRIGYWIFVT